MKKRALVAFTGILTLLGVVMLRLYSLAGNGLYQAADQQSSMTVTVANARGTIYDTQLRPFVNRETAYRACIVPGPSTLAAVEGQMDADALQDLTERMQSGRPVVTAIANLLSPLAGLTQFEVPVRSSGELLAPHVIGYLDGDGLHGATGVEYAMDEYLNAHGGKATVTYQVDAAGRPLQGEQPVIRNTLSDAAAGVVLTLDQDIQRLARDVARKYMRKGAVVVMEPATGRILAMVSLPEFQPDKVADCLDDPDSPLLNRALCNYNCGSVFKIVSAAAALEAGIGTSQSFACTGSIKVGESGPFHCHNRLGHGTLDMKAGFAQSCNPYFIQLMLRAGGSSLYSMASNMGFERSIILMENIKTARAILPSEEDLQSQAAVANLAFGQGTLLASPVHIAQMVAAVVNDGQIIRPTLLKGTVDAQGKVEETAIAPPQRAFSPQTAKTLRELMVNAVENGTGKAGKPLNGDAGGKTGTAETGWKVGDRDVVQSWFAGYYPADKPRYVITVLAEDANGTEGKSSPVFKEICDGLYMLEKSQKTG